MDISEIFSRIVAGFMLTIALIWAGVFSLAGLIIGFASFAGSKYVLNNIFGLGLPDGHILVVLFVILWMFVTIQTTPQGATETGEAQKRKNEEMI